MPDRSPGTSTHPARKDTGAPRAYPIGPPCFDPQRPGELPRLVREYFESRKARIRYRELRRRGIPLGSGAVESAIRRVVNLRPKGPSMFWRGPDAERMLHLRSCFKAGRWHECMYRVVYAIPTGHPPDGAVGRAA